MLTSDKNAEPTIVKFPVQPSETEREWRLDDADDTPPVEKEWKLDDTEPVPEIISHDIDLSDENVSVNVADDVVVETPPASPENALPETPPPTPTEKTLPENSPPAPEIQEKQAHWRVYAAVLGAVALSVWFSHASINAYWQQTYHTASPLEPLNRFTLWQMGAKMQNAVNGWFSSDTSAHENNTLAEETASPQTPAAEIPKPTATLPESASAPHSGSQDEQAVWLNSGDKVLFIGDSIMQGIAPHVQRWLKSTHQVDSLNLSKQSTGLSYPKFFDWPTTVEQTLQNDKNIKLLVVLFGANDPWDFPNPQGGAYLKFQSPEWEAEYLRRVNRIVQAAEQNQARIIWLGVPYMRRPDLDKGVRHLNQMLGNELVGKSPTVIWLPTDMLLSDGDSYQDSMTINGEIVRVRAKDGVHLNPAGQVFMSNYLNSYIKLK